jgi:addiction module HigA family antidote
MEEFVMHPGITLKRQIESLDITQMELAELTGFKQPYISDVLNGRRSISVPMAVQLERGLMLRGSGLVTTAYEWLCMQAEHDLEEYIGHGG